MHCGTKKMKAGGAVGKAVPKGMHKMPDGSIMPDSAHKKMKAGGKVPGNFIQGAIKKPGALREQMGVKAGETIPKGKLAQAAKAPGKLGQRARFAQTLAKMRKK